MRNVLLFSKNKPTKLIVVSSDELNINDTFPSARIRNMPLEIVFATFSNGESGAISVASDHYVSLAEIIAAHKKLILRD